MGRNLPHQGVKVVALDDGHTVELGTMDGDGYVKITGRFKEMILRGGENIYPRELAVEKMKKSP